MLGMKGDNLLTGPTLGLWVMSSVSIAFFSFLIKIGDEDKFIDWAYAGMLFRYVSPYYWTYTGIGIAVGLSILGAAWYFPRPVESNCVLGESSSPGPVSSEQPSAHQGSLRRTLSGESSSKRNITNCGIV